MEHNEYFEELDDWGVSFRLQAGQTYEALFAVNDLDDLAPEQRTVMVQPIRTYRLRCILCLPNEEPVTVDLNGGTEYYLTTDDWDVFGFWFAGWARSADGDPVPRDYLQLTEDTTIYGIWKPAIKLEDGIDVRLPACEWEHLLWLQYTPQTDGLYTLTLPDDNTVFWFSLDLFDEAQQQLNTPQDEEELCFCLQSGRTYYFRMECCCSEGAQCRIDLTEDALYPTLYMDVGENAWRSFALQGAFTYTIPGIIPFAWDGRTFEGWYCEETHTTYVAGDTITLTNDITLTALWSAPTQTNMLLKQLTLLRDIFRYLCTAARYVLTTLCN